MTDYWPRRSAPNGFSIEKLAKSYRAKISGIPMNRHDSVADEISGNSLIKIKSDDNLKKKALEMNYQKRDFGHWANRDFNEYFDCA